MTSPASAEPSAGEPARASRWVATGAVLLALVVAAFEGTVVTSTMPTIVGALGGFDVYAWVFAAFLLASTVGVGLFLLGSIL